MIFQLYLSENVSKKYVARIMKHHRRYNSSVCARGGGGKIGERMVNSVCEYGGSKKNTRGNARTSRMKFTECWRSKKKKIKNKIFLEKI